MKHGYHFNKKNSLKYENEEIVVVATFKEPFATCGEWRMDNAGLEALACPCFSGPTFYFTKFW